MGKSVGTRVFLSSVTQEYGLKRPELKSLFAGRGIDLSIQEDFADSPSPHGTLLKIYRFLTNADLVVHVVGSHPPSPAASMEFDELFAAHPQFREWLAEKAILPAVQSGDVGYTHFEAYMALYLAKPLVILQLGSGAQPNHENRLQLLGRHINGRVHTSADIVEQTLHMLDAEAQLDRHGHLTRAAKLKVLSLVGLILFITICVLGSFVIHLSIAANCETLDVLSFGQLLRPLASFFVLVVALVAIHMSAMTDKLRLIFRFRLALRNAAAWLVLTVSAASLIPATAVPYWFVLVTAVFVLGLAVRRDTRGLEEEIDNWRFGNHKQPSRCDGWYWAERRHVLDAVRVADFESMPAREN